MTDDTPLPFEWPEQETHPDRPGLHDEDVMRLAAETAADRIMKGWSYAADMNFTDEWEDLVEDLIDAFDDFDMDGYSICRRLESRSNWSPDAELVDLLDGGFVSEARREMVRRWVSIYGIKPRLSIGDELMAPYVGKIVSINLDTAEYVVDTGKIKQYVNYESAYQPDVSSSDDD